MMKLFPILVVLGFLGNVWAGPFHTDPTMDRNVKSALKYLGKLSDRQIEEIEKLDSGAEKLIRILDMAVRRQAAPTPLRYPRPPFKNPEDLLKVYETNPNADLFTTFKTELFSADLKKALSTLKEELTPVELSKLLSQISNRDLTDRQWTELSDLVSAYMIRCYNVLIVKAGHCHGPTRPFPESPEHSN